MVNVYCLSGRIDDRKCAVEGPMIVMRVRPDGMGEKVVSLLKRYLAYTQNEEEQWQHPGGWQLFEIVGDLGKSDQTEVMSKLSPRAKQRCCWISLQISSSLHFLKCVCANVCAWLLSQ